jgi:hypothetical protein
MKSLRYIIAIHKFEGNTGRGDGFYSLKQEVVASLEQKNPSPQNWRNGLIIETG